MNSKTEKILEGIIFNLKELNNETCSMKIPYSKEYEEYEKKNEELKEKGFNEEISMEELAQSHMKLIEDNIHLIEVNRNAKEKIRIYQKECEKKLCRLLVDYFNETNPPTLGKENNEEEGENILKALNCKLKEANNDTCSEKNHYNKEWEGYCKKIDQLLENNEITDEEADNARDKLLEENKEIIQGYKTENKRIEEYQNSCKAEALKLMFDYFDCVNIPEWKREGWK